MRDGFTPTNREAYQRLVVEALDHAAPKGTVAHTAAGIFDRIRLVLLDHRTLFLNGTSVWLARELRISRPTLTKILALLREAGLLVPRGKQVNGEDDPNAGWAIPEDIERALRGEGDHES